MMVSALFRTTFFLPVLLLLVPVPLRAQGSSEQETSRTPRSSATAPVETSAPTVRETFHAIQVAAFEIQKNVDFPPEYLAAMKTEISKEILRAKVFSEVVAPGESPAASSDRLLRLDGLITNYKPGSRAKRYFVGYGAGTTEIDSKITFVDSISGHPLMSQDLRAVLAGGLFGGKSEDSIKDYARQVVNKVKLMLNMRLPAPGETPRSIVGEAVGPVSSSAPVNETVILTQKDWSASQEKLDREAADGYRLTGLSICGATTAEAQFLRTDATADAFQYKILHTNFASNLQKDIHALAIEGFRVSPGTLVVLGGSPTVIVEKSNPPFKLRYAYLIKETMRVSRGEKDVAKVQEEGYALIGETEHGSAHLLLFEKTSAIP